MCLILGASSVLLGVRHLVQGCAASDIRHQGIFSGVLQKRSADLCMASRSCSASNTMNSAVRRSWQAVASQCLWNPGSMECRCCVYSLKILRDVTHSQSDLRTCGGGWCQQGIQLSWRQPAAGARRPRSVRSRLPSAAGCTPWHQAHQRPRRLQCACQCWQCLPSMQPCNQAKLF